MHKIIVNSIEEMEELGEILSKVISDGDVVALNGDLGAGKTTLAKSIAKSIDATEDATSPTFSLVNKYCGKRTINHLDLYRLDSPYELESFEYEDYFYPENSFTLIEWSERAGEYLPGDIIEIHIEVISDGSRCLTINENNEPEIRIVKGIKNASTFN